MQQLTPAISFTPSFTTTTHSSSSATLTDIAARVVHEFRLEQSDDFDDDLFGDVADHHRQNPTIQEKEEDDDSSGDFEFPSVCRDPPQSISADEIFYNGQIRPVFPVFGRTDLLFGGGGVVDGVDDGGKVMNCSSKPRKNQSTARASLRTLMREDSRDPPSCSSSESDDLDGVPAEIYCAWTPKSAAAAEVKKSGSTGSTSKRWRIRNLLFRSNSDGRGRDSFVFLASSNGKNKDDKGSSNRETATEKSSFGGGEVVPVTAAQEEEDNYGKSGVAAKDGERRRLYGRQNWVGFFANVNGVSSNLHPF
jgi:hypothetical protein